MGGRGVSAIYNRQLKQKPKCYVLELPVVALCSFSVEE